jgi:hypothetical protein
MPSIVSDVSAMFVAITTLREPGCEHWEERAVNGSKQKREEKRGKKGREKSKRERKSERASEREEIGHHEQARRILDQPGGAGSKMRVCISEGSAEYTGSTISSGTSGPSAFMRSYRISADVSISSCPVRKSRT